MTRLGLPAIGALGVAFGAALGPSGCFNCDCPPATEVRTGSFSIVGAADPSLVGGTLDVSAEAIVVVYERPVGTRWEASYRVTDR